jgi:hypothetical protein
MLTVLRHHRGHRRSGRGRYAISERPTPLPRALFTKADLCIPVPPSSVGYCKVSATGCSFPYFLYAVHPISCLFCRFQNSYRKNWGVGGPSDFQLRAFNFSLPNRRNRSISEFLPASEGRALCRKEEPKNRPRLVGSATTDSRERHPPGWHLSCTSYRGQPEPARHFGAIALDTLCIF